MKQALSILLFTIACISCSGGPRKIKFEIEFASSPAQCFQNLIDPNREMISDESKKRELLQTCACHNFQNDCARLICNHQNLPEECLEELNDSSKWGCTQEYLICYGRSLNDVTQN